MKRTASPLQLELFAPRPPADVRRRNLVLEAGAGTGKTTRIVGEVLRLLVENPLLEPDRLVLMTFTEKAAAEIADRIRSALVDLQAALANGLSPQWPASKDPVITIETSQTAEALAACDRHLGQLDRFRSQTIHSFCQGILRLHPIEAIVHPDFRIIQGAELTSFNARVYARWFQEETGARAPETRLAQWRVLFQHFKRLDDIQSIITTILLPKRDLVSDPSYTLAGIEDAEPQIVEGLRAIRALSPIEVARVSEPAAREILDYVRSSPPPPVESTLDAWFDYFVPIGDASESVSLKALGKGVAATRIRALIKDSKIKSVFSQIASHRAAVAIRPVAIRFFEALDAAKLEDGVLDFDDLLFRTAAVLEHRHVLEAVRKRYDFLFVDEFQDTDRVQARIIEALARDASGRLVPGRTVVVGDPKQSIYAFRRADPETYQAVTRALIDEGAELIPLLGQYRSEPSLVEDLNAICPRLFSEPGTESIARPQYAPPLVPQRESDGRHQPARITFLANAAPTPQSSQLQWQLQAEAIAAWMERIRVRDGSSWRRFSILLRAMTHLDDYADVFARRGIPCLVPPVRSLLERRPVVDLMAVLRAIAAPADRSALVSAARSPYFALTDDEIARSVLLPDSEVSEHFTRFRAHIDQYAHDARHLTVRALAERIIEDAEIESFYAGSSSPEEPLGQIERLLDIAMELDVSRGSTLAEFIAEIDRRRAAADESDPSWIDENADAVKILTVHAAKGLEFETVILPDLSSGTRSDRISVLSVESPKTLLLTGQLATLALSHRTTEAGELLDAVRSGRNDAEDDRLFYVAITRARSDVVFVCDREKQNAAGFWKRIARIFAFDKETFPDLWPEGAGEQMRELRAGNRDVQVVFEALTLSGTSNAVLGPKDAIMTDESIDAWGSTEMFLPEPVTSIERLDRGEIRSLRAAAARIDPGLAIHRFLEVWDGTETTRANTVDSVAGEAGLSEAGREALKIRATAIARSPIFHRILRAETIAREMTIYTRDGKGLLVQKRLDRLVREPEGLLVIDYKSGQPQTNRATEDQTQVRSYVEAIRLMTGESCSGMVWYLENDQVVEVADPTSQS